MDFYWHAVSQLERLLPELVEKDAATSSSTSQQAVQQSTAAADAPGTSAQRDGRQQLLNSGNKARPEASVILENFQGLIGEEKNHQDNDNSSILSLEDFTNTTAETIAHQNLQQSADAATWSTAQQTLRPEMPTPSTVPRANPIPNPIQPPQAQSAAGTVYPPCNQPALSLLNNNTQVSELR